MDIANPKTEDFDDVLDFMIRCDVTEFGEPDTSREDLEQLWSEINLASDAWLARDEQQRVIGFANVSDTVDGYQMDIYLHLLLSPPSIEDILMRFCLERAQKMHDEAPQGTKLHLRGYASSKSTRLQQIYEKSGFDRHTYHYRMQIDFSGPFEQPVWPDNYQLAAYRPEDELELYQFIQRAFDWPGHKDTPIDLWRSLVFRGGQYDPEVFLLVRDVDSLVGAALSYDEEGSGWIRQLAVEKEYRGKGLGSLLLRQMFYIFQQRNAASVALGVASVNANAINFYERSGMYRSREFIEYRKNFG
jgi:mycothiol synthase